ncbi:leucine-rich melanocyte differentiation-associated protein-like isoform X2 [Mya arenaria]|uniref:leucine-rich melanocyte differentiation-associated protein-like isoform X2 n=1 Tax=Mya arenaria TaxID=6604 RepID=UPI0022E05AD7|nr:leucine-rich melanocyte differentiation-associated protein-like isoform X2 [Mya arenaria]
MDQHFKRQNLTYQNYTEVPAEIIQRTAKYVEELDLSYNRISDLRFLSEYTSLQSLVLDHNQLTPHLKMPEMPLLHTFWVNHNNIENLGVFIGTLAKRCPNLRYLSMMNNTAAPSYFNDGTYEQYTDYRHYVISKFPKLGTLDDKKIEADERSEAERIYKPVPRKKRKAKPPSSS